MDEPPIPANFGVKYVLWFLWCHAITVLMIVQAVLSAITLDPTLVSHEIFHWILIGNAVLCAVLAQINRKNPLAQPPQEMKR